MSNCPCDDQVIFQTLDIAAGLNDLPRQIGGFPQDHLIHNYVSGFTPASYPIRIKNKLRRARRRITPTK